MGSGKKSKPWPATDKERRGKRSNCRCSRCGVYSQQLRGDLKRAGGVRCVCCGGNVVAARQVYDCDIDQEYRNIVSQPAAPVAKEFEKTSAERTREFMELVDCEEHEVKDTPARKPSPKPTAAPGSLTGSSLMPWGIHEGRRLRDVPPDYLKYIAFSKDNPAKSTPNSRQFKRDLQRYLAAA